MKKMRNLGISLIFFLLLPVALAQDGYTNWNFIVYPYEESCYSGLQAPNSSFVNFNGSRILRLHNVGTEDQPIELVFKPMPNDLYNCSYQPTNFKANYRCNWGAYETADINLLPYWGDQEYLDSLDYEDLPKIKILVPSFNVTDPWTAPSVFCIFDWGSGSLKYPYKVEVSSKTLLSKYNHLPSTRLETIMDKVVDITTINKDMWRIFYYLFLIFTFIITTVMIISVLPSGIMWLFRKVTE